MECRTEVLLTTKVRRWTRPYIEVSQLKNIEELEEILVERNTKETLHIVLHAHMLQDPLRTDKPAA